MKSRWPAAVPKPWPADGKTVAAALAVHWLWSQWRGAPAVRRTATTLRGGEVHLPCAWPRPATVGKRSPAEAGRGNEQKQMHPRQNHSCSDLAAFDSSRHTERGSCSQIKKATSSLRTGYEAPSLT